MERILNQLHSKEAYFYCLSKMLERAAYYGLRGIIVFYMVSESINIERSEAINIYTWLGGLLIFSQIIGAVLGDLIIGNKKSILIGGIIQAIGAFSLCIPSITGFYIGLFLLVLGGGLYVPNIISNFGKLYLNKTKLLDAGFSLFYFVINLGAFLGVLLINYCGSIYGWNVGFILSGILMLFSIIPILISQEESFQNNSNNNFPIRRKVIIISFFLIIIALFRTIYDISDIRIIDLQTKLSKLPTMNISESIWSSLDSIFHFPISIIAIIVWTNFYNSQFFKLIVGFIFTSIAFGILFLIPELPSEKHAILYFISLFCLGVSEIHISPIVDSIVTKYTNPKYLAIVLSLVFIPTRLFAFMLSLFNEGLSEEPIMALTIGMFTITIISIGLILCFVIKPNMVTKF